MDFLEMVATVVQNSARHSLKWVILGLLSTCLASERFFFELWPDVDMSVAGELRAVKIRGNRIEYYDVGRGEVLLLIHGGRTDATDWQNVLAALARHYHLVIADGMVYPFDARDLWWLLDHLGVSRVAIVAHSAGTLVGKEMYFMRPDRVWAFVNVDSHQLGGRSDGHELPNQHCSPQVQALHQKNDSRLARLEESRIRDYPSEVNVRRLTLFYRQKELIPEAGTRSVNRNYPQGRTKVLDPPPPNRPRPEAVKISGRLAPLPQKVDVSGDFKCPVLVFNAGYGKVDAADPPHETLGWNGGPLRAVSCEFVLVRDSGHWIWLDQPQIFLDRTLSFLRPYSAGQ